MNIKDAKAKEIGDTMILSGVVTVLPGILSSQYFYIQDADSGIQVYNFRSIFPSLKIGDFIKVKGVLANSNGEIRLKIVAESDIEIVSSSENPVIKELEINDISEEYSGLLITTTGEVQETSGNIFVITDSNNQIKVLIRESADIKKPKMKKGDKVKATGILSVYKGELRILPINRDGVIILSAGVLPITGCEIGDGFMKYNLSNITDTEIFAEKIAKSLKGGDILLLKGELGSGKTTLTQLVLSKLGIVENVTSPTYVIMKNYLVPTVQNHISEVAHVDAYRLDENSDINEIGLQDYIKRDNTLIIIEWPEKINDFLPADCKIIEVSVKSQNSRLCVTNWEF